MQGTRKKSIRASAIRLCGACLRRQGISKSEMGRLAVKADKSSDCEICGGRLARLSKLATDVAEKLSPYEFKNFLIGTSVPQQLLDREDEIRSSLRIRGRESIKAHITRTICKKVSKITGKKVDRARPDVTVLVPLGDEPLTIMPRSIWLSARYTKKERGIPQKNKTCSVCSGLGCASCDFKGTTTNSVQTIATDFFNGIFESEGCNFIWIGGEDENSLVLGSGRQFFIEVAKPKKRSFPPSMRPVKEVRASASRETTSPLSPIYRSGELSKGIEFSSIEILPVKPTRIPMFKMECEVHLLRNAEVNASTPTPIDSSEIEKEFSGIRISVQVSRKFKRVSKFIESIKLTEEEDGGNRLALRIRCDGGIPIKKFVDSTDNSVSPNLSNRLNEYKIDESMPFDVLDITLLPANTSQQNISGIERRRPERRRGGRKNYRRDEANVEDRSIDDEGELLEALNEF